MIITANMNGKSGQKFSRRKPFVPTGNLIYSTSALSPSMNRVVDFLTFSVFATGQQLRQLCGVSRMSLYRYYHHHLIDRVPLPFANPTHSMAYALGEWGHGASASRHAPILYPYPVNALYAADIIAINEVALRLYQMAYQGHLRPNWMGCYETALLLERPLAETDPFHPFVILQTTNEVYRTFLIELHTTHDFRSARQKIQAYEQSLQMRQLHAGTGQQPLFLFVFATKLLADEFAAGFSQQHGTWQGRYLGKLFQWVDSAPTDWWDFRQQKMVNVLAKELS